MADLDMSLDYRRALKVLAASRPVPPPGSDAAAPPAPLAELDRRAASHLCRIERKLDQALHVAAMPRASGALRTWMAITLGFGLGLLLTTLLHP